MYNHKLISFFLLMGLLVQAQYNYSSSTAHMSIVQAIKVNNDIIKERTANFEKKAADKPLMFVNVKKKISQLNWASNDLSVYIKEIQKEVNSERVLYELLDDDFYEKLLFTDDGGLSIKGQKLKAKITNIYQVGRGVNTHGLTGLTDFSNEHFNVQEVYYNSQEKEIDYFEHFFFDRSNYGIMMTMNYLLLDVKLFQLMYFRTVMSY